MNLDLSRTIQSVGFMRNPETGKEIQVKHEAEIRKVVIDMTANTRSFMEALKVQSLREKAKSAENEVVLTPEEVGVLLGIYRNRPTDEKLAIMEILQELNPSLDPEFFTQNEEGRPY